MYKDGIVSHLVSPTVNNQRIFMCFGSLFCFFPTIEAELWESPACGFCRKALTKEFPRARCVWTCRHGGVHHDPTIPAPGG